MVLLPRFSEYTDLAALIADIRAGLLAYVDLTTSTQFASKHEGDPLAFGGLFPALTVSYAGFSWSPRTSDRSRMPGVVNFRVKAVDIAIGNSDPAQDRKVDAEKRCIAAMSEWYAGWMKDPRLSNRAMEVRPNTGDAGDADRFGNSRLDEMRNILYVHDVEIQILV